MGLLNIAARYTKIVYAAAHVGSFIGSLTMVGLMLLTVADVVLRYFFNSPILGSFELTEFALVLLVFFAIPWGTAQKINVRVDLFVGPLPDRIRAIFDSITCLFSILITALFAWYTLPQARYMMELGSESDMLEIPLYPFYYMVAAGFFLLFFVLIGNLIDFINEAKKG
ncbi:MAG TPA: TRAP transporter small permease [Desulfobacteraceae bacterium]|nr:TRAP transporter small permease [Desulfobacteraceae bacterium]